MTVFCGTAALRELCLSRIWTRDLELGRLEAMSFELLVERAARNPKTSGSAFNPAFFFQ
jgi:hypothetical protein